MRYRCEKNMEMNQNILQLANYQRGNVMGFRYSN